MIEITSYCMVRHGKASLNNELIFEDNGIFNGFVKNLYRNLNIGYPKFFKMDRLSKLALVSSEILLRSRKLSEEYKPERIGIYLANRAASLDTDRVHQASIKNRNEYFPSPAVFVYTLPNIAVGEIAIKQKIKGGNNFFIFDKFEASFFANYVENQMKLKKIDSCLFGWVNVDEEDYDSVLFLAEKKQGIYPLNSSTLNNIYNK